MLSHRKKQKNSQGFTIVETLIVLAIAGLILVIVLEAFPALERSGANNQRRQDIQIMLSGVSAFELNNSGEMPSNGTEVLEYINKKLSYYTTSDIHVFTSSSIYSTASSPATITYTPDLSNVTIANHQKCTTSGGVQTSTYQGAGFNDVVILFTLQSGSSPTDLLVQCEQL